MLTYIDHLHLNNINLPSVLGWHFDSQTPHLPWPPTCWPKSSTIVEHQAFVSPGSFSAVVQHLWVSSPNLNGNTQGLFGSGPLVVLQPISRQSAGQRNKMIDNVQYICVPFITNWSCPTRSYCAVFIQIEADLLLLGAPASSTAVSLILWMFRREGAINFLSLNTNIRSPEKRGVGFKVRMSTILNLLEYY